MGDWERTTLGNIASLYSGGTPSRDQARYWGGTIPWVSAKDMKRFRLDDSEDHLTAEGAANGTRLIPAGTILLLTRGMTLLHDIPICVTQREMAFNQDVKAIQPKRNVSSDFLAYLLLGNKERLLAAVDLAGHGTGRLNTEEIKGLEFLLPPEAEQRAIAGILSTLDDKIELNRRMSETLEAMARALFKSWFVDFDPVRAKMEGRDPGLAKPLTDLFPDRLVDSELGEIPERWKVEPICALADVVGGSTPKTERTEYWDDGTHHWVTPKDLSGLSTPVLLATERKITASGLAQISSGLLPEGTVLLSSRAPIGYLAIAEIPVAINQGFIAMKAHTGISNLYLLRWAEAAHAEIESRANGSTFLEISKSSFRPIPAVAPSSAVMDAFDRISRPMYRSLVNLQRESRALANLRDALLPQLVSGELRVSDAERIMARRSS